jgi:hypothetical protein
LRVHTLTRAEVAKRLGKSIATVRRLEYRVLYPERDERGVLRFDEADVERARRDPDSLRVYARSRWLEEKVRDDAQRRREVPTGSGRSSRKNRAATAELSVQLADDLQAALNKLVLSFDAKRLRTCGFDSNVVARAFHVAQRLRALGSGPG